LAGVRELHVCDNDCKPGVCPDLDHAETCRRVELLIIKPKTTKIMKTKTIVFGKDEIETYLLLNAIANRRLREENRAKRRLRMKRLIFGYLAKLRLRGGGHE